MNLNRLIAIGKEIRNKLIEIRRRAGASLGEYMSGEELANYASKYQGQPIFIDGEFRVVYIKDNSFHDRIRHNEEIRRHPNDCFVSGNKVHFYYCRTLISMTNRGRYARYRVTPEIENTRIIDLRDKKDLATRLPWCQNCINTLYRKRGVHNPQQIAEYGDAEELMDRVKADPAAIQMMVEFAKDLKGVIPSTDYPPHWREMSNGYRKKRGYTCEFCGVNCSNNTKLTDAHHKDGDKTNCDDENLECLCKYHHAQKDFHGHYKVKEEDMQALRKLWEEKGTPHDLRG